MKKNLILLSALFLIGITQVNAQCCKPTDSKVKKENTTQQEGKTVKLKITGMTCNGCASHVENDVNKLPGIVKVDASYEEATAKVKFDQTKVSLAQIEEAINGTGYKVVGKK